MATYLYRLPIHRPVRSQLTITVRFVMASALAQLPWQDEAPLTCDTDALPTMHLCEPLLQEDTARGKMAMRLRLIGSGVSNIKEYRNAESLPA